jgi:TonB family protein
MLLAVTAVVSPVLGAQRPADSPPSANRIVTRDGDTVVVENDARVRIVQRREGQVRAVFNAEERWLILLVDYATSTRTADGIPDRVHYYREVGGAWPFGPRWEGSATIDEYSVVARGTMGLGVATTQGLVQLLNRTQEFRDGEAVAVLSYSSYGSSAVELPFDEAERWYTAEMQRNDGVVRSRTGAGTTGSLTLGVTGGVSGVPARSGVQTLPNGAVRVGGSVRPPRKLVNVAPVPPETALRAGIKGTVILEVTVDIDGSVKEARVLRGIPLLDASALEAVRQWRYEPTEVSGKPVPVTMTVSVVF